MEPKWWPESFRERGGQLFEGIPIFDAVEQAKQETKGKSSVIFVPPSLATDAVLEALEARLDLIVCLTEGVSPVKDALMIREMSKGKKTFLVGPNTPGVITPGEAKVGVSPIPFIVREELAWFPVVDRFPTRSRMRFRRPASDSPLAWESVVIPFLSPPSRMFYPSSSLTRERI